LGWEGGGRRSLGGLGVSGWLNPDNKVKVKALTHTHMLKNSTECGMADNFFCIAPHLNIFSIVYPHCLNILG